MRIVIVFIVVATSSFLSFAASVIPFQGQLTDQAGASLIPSGPINLVFRLYQAPTGGTASWEETQPNVVIIGGRFNVLLGARTPFDSTTLAAFNNTVYLGITVDDGDPATTDVELRPRQAIVPVIFSENAGRAANADNAANADKLDGFDWSNILVGGSNDPTTALIDGNKVGTVGNAILANRAVDGAGFTPVGGIIAWFSNVAAAPSNWKLCDGTVINDASSPLNGRTAPNLNSGLFVRGSTTATFTPATVTPSYTTGNAQGANLNNHHHLSPIMEQNGVNAGPAQNNPFGMTLYSASGANNPSGWVSPTGTTYTDLTNPNIWFFHTSSAKGVDLNAHQHSIPTIVPPHIGLRYIMRIK